MCSSVHYHHVDYIVDISLPAEGYLLVFVDAHTMCGVAVYVPEGTPLHRAVDATDDLSALPGFEACTFSPYAHARELCATPAWSLPCDMTEAADWGPAWSAVTDSDATLLLDYSNDLTSHLLGYGYYYSGCNAPDIDSTQAAVRAGGGMGANPPAHSAYRLLLQLYEEESCGYWHVWARTEDLLARRYDALDHLLVSFDSS